MKPSTVLLLATMFLVSNISETQRIAKDVILHGCILSLDQIKKNIQYFTSLLNKIICKRR